MIQVISSVLVRYLDSQTPSVQAELVGQEDRVTPDTYSRGRERDNLLKVAINQQEKIVIELHFTNECTKVQNPLRHHTTHLL